MAFKVLKKADPDSIAKTRAKREAKERLKREAAERDAAKLKEEELGLLKSFTFRGVNFVFNDADHFYGDSFLSKKRAGETTLKEVLDLANYEEARQFTNDSGRTREYAVLKTNSGETLGLGFFVKGTTVYLTTVLNSTMVKNNEDHSFKPCAFDFPLPW